MKYFLGFIFLMAASSTVFSQQIQIRNTASITHSTDTKPLIVIDGNALPKLIRSKTDSTRLVDPLTEIDPSDIEKMEIFKDESAVKLYGESGKNGVVIITTKAYSQNPKKQ